MSDRRSGGPPLARILGALGRTMITVGVLILLFVAYQLWGTGIRTAQAQRQLEDEFAHRLEEAGVDPSAGATTSTTSTTTVDPTTSTVSTVPATIAPPMTPDLLPVEGEAAGQIVIPAIGLDWIFVEGVTVADLKEGPGHYPETSLPGQSGNSAIAGHRTTYGAPFADLDQLQVGDRILVITVQGRFTYEVRETIVVSPSQVEVLGIDYWDFDDDPTTPHNALTLTACHPRYSARQRIVIGAELVGEPAPTLSPEGDDPPSPVEFDSNLSGERTGAAPAVAWAAISAGIWLVAWAVGRAVRKARWPAYAIGIVPFLVALFFFFENVSRLLPANY